MPECAQAEHPGALLPRFPVVSKFPQAECLTATEVGDRLMAGSIASAQSGETVTNHYQSVDRIASRAMISSSRIRSAMSFF